MLFWQILIDGFAISSLYALGATGGAVLRNSLNFPTRPLRGQPSPYRGGYF